MKIKAKVTNTFACNGQTYTPGMVIRFPEGDLEKLQGYVDILPDQSLTRYERNLQQQSSEWRCFCDLHELTLDGSICQLKRGKQYDPFQHCVGWMIKNKRAIH